MLFHRFPLAAEFRDDQYLGQTGQVGVGFDHAIQGHAVRFRQHLLNFADEQAGRVDAAMPEVITMSPASAPPSRDRKPSFSLPSWARDRVPPVTPLLRVRLTVALTWVSGSRMERTLE